MKRIVVKIGSSTLAPRGEIDYQFLHNIVEDIVALEKKGIRIILVSSGAIACGLKKLNYRRKPKNISVLMAAAAVGQRILMDLYSNSFSKYEKLCSQILLTWDDFNDRVRYLNARKTITQLLTFKVIPIVNENDTVASDEIKFGDNDRLSAMVSDLIGAQKLIILSDVEGLYSGQSIIKQVEKIDQSIFKLASQEDSHFTTGGMVTKLEAARMAVQAGIPVVIAGGHVRGVLSQIMKGETIGTFFKPCEKIENARKRWIALSKKIKGCVTIDEGAKRALLFSGKSLLAVGITDFHGKFNANDCVEVRDQSGVLLGCGLINYSSGELLQRSARQFSKEAIHRDNFAKRSSDE